MALRRNYRILRRHKSSKGNVIDKEEYVRTLLRGKLVTSDKFPNDDMSFTEMSENVLEKPYKNNTHRYTNVVQSWALC